MDLFSLFGEDNNISQEKEMEEVVEKLNKASDAYYNDSETMSNFEYDILFDELSEMEKQTGVILPNSPTQKVGAEVTNSKLSKVTHEYPALSLNKTKEVGELKEWLGVYKGVLTPKCDGATLVCTYDNGKLIQVATRGNGYVGEDVTMNAYHFDGIPHEISYKGHLVVRGEGLMHYSEFDRIVSETGEDFKNPRNLASGTIRALDIDISKNRKITFYAFQCVTGFQEEGIDYDSVADRLSLLKDYGFNVVPFVIVDSTNLEEEIGSFSEAVKGFDYPTDGLVVSFDSTSYGESLGMTGRYPRYGMAFKWADEEHETILRSIEWSASRTGLLNPVAVFDSVEIEGTTVSRASVHNISVCEDLGLGIGCKIKVYKANMIIPQISKVVESSGVFEIPSVCPVCMGKTEVHSQNGIKTLHCIDPFCSAKKIGSYERFVDRDAMNIEGLSTATLGDFIAKGFIEEYADIYYLSDFKNEIEKMEGYGSKSYTNIISAIEKSRDTTFEAFMYAMGIDNIGRGQLKLLKKHIEREYDSLYEEYELDNQLDGSYDLMGMLTHMVNNGYDFTQIEGFGDVIHKSLTSWVEDKLLDPYRYGFDEEDNSGHDFDVINVLKELRFHDEKKEISAQNLEGKVFVITGSLETYTNRDELVKVIESLGGKVSGSVSSKTSYLINNDVSSTTGKNKKAKELSIPIISEADFNAMKGE